MPAPLESTLLTPHEEAKWRAEFEERGRQSVRDATISGGMRPDRKQKLALEWLREKERAAEKRDADTDWYLKWTWRAAAAAAVLTVLAILIALLHL
jgi:hypothetical protein